MYAIVRRTPYQQDKLPQVTEGLAEFQKVHAAQRGYLGTVIVDAGDGVWLTLNLWESEQAAAAALPTMVPVVQRILDPAMRGPSEIIGAGAVVLTDLTGA